MTRPSFLSLLLAFIGTTLLGRGGAQAQAPDQGGLAFVDGMTPVCPSEAAAYYERYGYDPGQVRANPHGYPFYQREDGCWMPVACPRNCTDPNAL